ncbi:MAG: EpsG family protein [Prevotellaceae bacterium]|nr:EpsG family protein [Prevotellaceae bacterium]
MFDITATECSQGMYIFCSLYYLFVSLGYKTKYTRSRTLSNRIDRTLVCLVFTYILFSFINGDYWHYREFVINYDEYWKPSEELYEMIADGIGRNYILFRCVVWGGALILFLQIIKKYNLNYNTSLYYIFTIYILIFSYARATLAMAVFFEGFSFLFKTNNNRNIIVGILLMLLSYFFHHSMLALIGLSFFCFLPLNKYLYISLFFLLPVIASMIGTIFQNFIGIGIDGLELVYRKMEGYREYEALDKSFLETIRSAWLYSLFYIPFIISTWIILIKKTNELPIYIKKLYSMTYAIVLFATSILFLGFNNNIMYYRLLYMSMIPLTILICYFREKSYISLQLYKLLIYYSIWYMVVTDVKKLLRYSPIS